jgi:hypothetical protein
MRLLDRKSRLTFITNSTARYRGKNREIVIEVFPEYAAVRLLGTRTRYQTSWRTFFDVAAEIYDRGSESAGKRKGKYRHELPG